ncbi:hypothetical protein CRG98_042899, partial [Punica granatum]
MAGRRDGSLMREKGQSFRGSRIAVAIAVGVLLGCVLALLYPNGLFSSNPPRQLQKLSRSGLQTASSSCESQERVNALKSDIASLSEKNMELKKQ